MTVGRSTKVLKFLVLFFLIIVVLLTLTQNKISETVQMDGSSRSGRTSFLGHIQEQFRNKNADSTNGDVVKSQQELDVGQLEDSRQDIYFDDSIPGGYMRFLDPAPVNKSYCRYNYDLPYDLIYNKTSYVFPPQLGKESPYRVLYNVTEAYDVEDAPQITYATHMTTNFAYFIPELLRKWDGLITVAAFVPDLDTAFFLEQVNQFCYCEPEMYRVSIHIVTHKLLAFSKKDVYFDRPTDCIPQDSSKIRIYTEFDDTVVYPVNVLRNIARTSSLTEHVLLSDVELMPSKGLATGFLNFIQIYNRTSTKEVFVLPIFEVEENEPLPQNKEELLELMSKEKAVYFHQLVCPHCQKFPGLEQWMESGFSEDIQPLVTVKRHDPYHRWEPIFIGTNKEPFYSEQLSWEGFQDKMTQSLEMCLQNYDYTILDNAFLCHWPGIKKQKMSDEEWRADFVRQNKEAHDIIVKNLTSRYQDIPECKSNATIALKSLQKIKTT